MQWRVGPRISFTFAFLFISINFWVSFLFSFLFTLLCTVAFTIGNRKACLNNRVQKRNEIVFEFFFLLRLPSEILFQTPHTRMKSNIWNRIRTNILSCLSNHKHSFLASNAPVSGNITWLLLWDMELEWHLPILVKWFDYRRTFSSIFDVPNSLSFSSVCFWNIDYLCMFQFTFHC